MFIRCLSEQTIVENEKRRLCTKEDGTMNSTSLQNPSDPEATFRTKAGKNHRGYVANLEESVGRNGSVVTDYAYEQNIHSDNNGNKYGYADKGSLQYPMINNIGDDMDIIWGTLGQRREFLKFAPE